MKEELKRVLRYLISDYVSFLVWIFTVLFTAMFLAGIEKAGFWLVITAVYIFGQIMAKGTLVDLYQMKISKEKFYKEHGEAIRLQKMDGIKPPVYPKSQDKDIPSSADPGDNQTSTNEC